MSAGEWVLAVDLGTTRTRAGYTFPGSREPVQVQVLPSEASSLSSSVARDPDGGWLVGDDAEKLRIGWTGAFFQNAKRLLGQVEPHYIDGHPFSILEIAAQPLIHMAMLARAQADHVFDRLALAVPVEWEGFRRELIVQVGEMAGFPPSHISVTTEADAAARAALGPTPQDGVWLLFDMGGGTLDVALLRTRAGGLQLLDTFGTDEVSGYVLDTAIMEHLRATYDEIGAAKPKSAGNHKADPAGEERREILLRVTAEQAKTGVTARGSGRASLPEPPVSVALSPDALRKLAAPVIERALGLCEELLTSNSLEWSDVTAIVCSGGSTRGPVIRDLLAAKAPVRDASGTPELAVVRGLLTPLERSRAAHPKTIRPANVGGVHLLRTLSLPGTVSAVAFDRSGAYLAAASSNVVQVWNPADGMKLWDFGDHTSTVRTLAFGSNDLLASGGDDQTIRLRAPGRSEKVEEAGTSVYSLAFSEDGSLLAWGGGDACAHIWTTDTGTEVAEPFTGHNGTVVAMAFAPDGSVLAAASGNVIRLWDPVDGTVRAVLAGHASAVAALAFSPDSTRLASASHDKTVRVWDLELDICQLVFSKHGNTVRSVAFSPTGELIASGGDDYYLRLWNPATGEEYTPPGSQDNYIMALAFSPDGTLLATGGYNDQVRIWGLG